MSYGKFCDIYFLSFNLNFCLYIQIISIFLSLIKIALHFNEVVPPSLKAWNRALSFFLLRAPKTWVPILKKNCSPNLEYSFNRARVWLHTPSILSTYSENSHIFTSSSNFLSAKSKYSLVQKFLHFLCFNLHNWEEKHFLRKKRKIIFLFLTSQQQEKKIVSLFHRKQSWCGSDKWNWNPAYIK